MFNVTFNTISVISWRLVLLVEETEIPGERHRSVASHSETLSHNDLSSTPHLSGIRTKSKIVEEAGFFVEVLEKNKGLPVCNEDPIRKAISNVTCSIIFGNRFS
jgi:hypothetical protein